VLFAFGHLALKSWFAMVAAMSTNTLGFLVGAIGISSCIWLAGLGYEWFALRDLRQALGKSVKFLFIDFAGVCLFLGIAYPTLVIRTVYFDHTGLKYESQSNKSEVQKLNRELEFRRHNMSAHDPVFTNMTRLLEAFAVYRIRIHGESCAIKITAPDENNEFATGIGNFSNAVSTCTTMGPFMGITDPDITKETTDGAIPDAIVFHAGRDDKAANELFDNLSNQIKLIRRYDSPEVNNPRGTYSHVVWLQFGSKTKWTSEMFP
jgi:hypothetical protein